VDLRAKKITDRKRHIIVDTLGRLLSVAVHPANIQDHDGVAAGAQPPHASFVPVHWAHSMGMVTIVKRLVASSSS
jgi:hypothetical protein